MEGLDLVAECNDNEGNDECSEVVEGNESENDELVGNIHDEDFAIQSHVNQLKCIPMLRKFVLVCTSPFRQWPVHHKGRQKMIDTILKTMG